MYNDNTTMKENIHDDVFVLKCFHSLPFTARDSEVPRKTRTHVLGSETPILNNFEKKKKCRGQRSRALHNEARRSKFLMMNKEGENIRPDIVWLFPESEGQEKPKEGQESPTEGQEGQEGQEGRRERWADMYDDSSSNTDEMSLMFRRHLFCDD